MKIVGTNFTNNAVILWNGSKLATSIVDGTTLSGSIQGGSLAVPGTAQVQVQNSQTGQSSQSVPVSIISSSKTVALPLEISTPALSAGALGTAYSAKLAASGGTAAYSWSITSGSLPAGLTLAAANGAILGTPTASGTFSFTVTVGDSSSPVQTQSAVMSITIAAAPAVSTQLTITASTLASGTNGTAYSQSLHASGGTPAYTWSISSGSLPAGLTLAAGSGAISGTPTASGTFPFTAAVSDNSNPVQTQSAAMSITIAPTASTVLTITSSSTLPSGTDSTAYSQTLTASGGTQPYTWSITSGSLPAGLTLGSATGTISGTPTASGLSTFTVTVTDRSNPAQTKSAVTTITLAAAASALPGTTWYVRPDGGTRYSSNMTTGQCNGKANAPYSGTGVNQPCAFNDVRYLWEDGSYATDGSSAPSWGWVIAGGDTVIISSNTSASSYRIGWNNNTDCGTGVGPYFGLCGDPYGSYPPPIPSGTAGDPTQILGANYASCAAPSAKTFINPGYGASFAFNLSGSAYVNLECLDMSDHAECSRVGVTQIPTGCSTSAPIDDFADAGLLTTNTTNNVTMQDLNIHGFTKYGLFGPIGGLITMTRVRVAYNGFAGWMFDDGNATPDATGSVLNASYVTMEWNGCNEEYPIVDTYPAISCYDDSNGGFGDAWSAQGSGSGGQISQLSMTCSHCVIDHNTKDGFGMNHIIFNSLIITDSTSYDNMGQQWKWGENDNSTVVFTNNLALSGCNRMSQPIAGAPASYNTYLSDFCRAEDLIAIDLGGGTASTLFANNTIVGYNSTAIDISVCLSTTQPNCAGQRMTFTNNILLGYADTLYNNGTPPGAYYPNGGTAFTVIRSNNDYYNMRDDGCPSTGFPGEICTDPQFVAEPPSPIGAESDLDNFNFNLSSTSPAISSGVAVPSVTTDYTGFLRPNPPSMGAYQWQ